MAVSHAQAVNDIQVTETGDNQTITPISSEYAVNTPASVLKVYVGKAGMLSAMGHNHIITFQNITGRITSADENQEAKATLRISLGDAIVDDEQERRQAGEQYDSIPDESARISTWNNMMGPRVLDLDRYPQVDMDIIQSTGDEDTNMFEVTLNFKDAEYNFTLPATVATINETMFVDSKFQLNHEQLDLRPFSAVGGLLRVAEEIRFEMYVEAIRQ